MIVRDSEHVFFRFQSTPNCRENLYSATASVPNSMPLHSDVELRTKMQLHLVLFHQLVVYLSLLLTEIL